MATSIQVALKSGKTQALLPDNRTLRPGKTIALSPEEFAKIPASARESLLDITVVTTPQARDSGFNLTLNSSSLPAGHRLGMVIQGTEDQDLFQLVKLGDAVNGATGHAVCWSSADQFTVTSDRAGGTSTDKFAGVLLGTVTAGNYCWLQISGTVKTLTSGNLTAGMTVALHPTTDGTVREKTGTDVTVGTLLENANSTTGNVVIASTTSDTLRRARRSRNVFTG